MAHFRTSLNKRGARGVIREAIDQIPSGTLVSTCLPLAGDLAAARPHLRAMLGLIGILVFTSQTNVWYSTVSSPGPAQRFRFRPLRARDNSEPAGRIANLRVLQNGAPIRAASTQAQNGSSVLVSFESMVHFNGWAFDTAPNTPVDKDPVVFYLEFERDGKWMVAGGSSPFYFGGAMTYVPLPYGTCRPRGCSNVFNELEDNFHSNFHTVAIWWIGCTYLRIMMGGTIKGFLKDQHLRVAILYAIGCVLLFARGVLRNLRLEFSPEMGLREQARLLYDCAGLALPGDTLPYVLLSVVQLVDDKLYITMNDETGLIGFGNAFCWNGVCLCLCLCVSSSARGSVCVSVDVCAVGVCRPQLVFVYAYTGVCMLGYVGACTCHLHAFHAIMHMRMQMLI
jgi:hypothetical protein